MWVSVKHELPEQLELVVTFSKDVDLIYSLAWMIGNDWHTGSEIIYPSHWMALPDEPTEPLLN